MRASIKSNLAKNAITPILLLLIFTALFQILNAVGQNQSKYSVDNMMVTIQTSQQWHSQISEESKKYTLGTYDQSFLGLISVMPEAIFVAVFRPFIWESTLGLMLFSAIENLFILALVIRTVLLNFRLFFSYVSKNPILIYSIVFTLSLAFMVGVSSYNFGALTRYRISFVPLLLSVIIIAEKNMRHMNIEKLNSNS